MYNVFLLAVRRVDQRTSQSSTLKFDSSIHARSDLIAWKTPPPKAFLSFRRTEYEDGKIEYDGISGLSLDSVTRTISGSCISSRAWNSVECLELLRPLQLIIIPFSFVFMLRFDELVAELDLEELFLVSATESDRISKEFDKFRVFEDKSRSVGEKLGMSQPGQSHEHEEFASSWYSSLFIPKQRVWIQVSHESHCIPCWFDLPGFLHRPQEYFQFGPGFTLTSPQRQDQVQQNTWLRFGKHSRMSLAAIEWGESFILSCFYLSFFCYFILRFM